MTADEITPSLIQSLTEYSKIPRQDRQGKNFIQTGNRIKDLLVKVSDQGLCSAVVQFTLLETEVCLFALTYLQAALLQASRTMTLSGLKLDFSRTNPYYFQDFPSAGVPAKHWKPLADEYIGVVRQAAENGRAVFLDDPKLKDVNERLYRLRGKLIDEGYTDLIPGH